MIEMYSKLPKPDAYDRREWLEARRRIHKRCGAGMRIANVDDAMIKLDEPKNGFVYKYWPYFECKSCRYQEAF